jgi:hypothetical protein
MFSKLSIAFVAALAFVAEAKLKNHALHQKSSNGTTVVSSVTVVPIPLSTSAVAPTSTYPVSGDTTLTYTLGTGTSTSVVTTTISHVSIRLTEPRDMQDVPLELLT